MRLYQLDESEAKKNQPKAQLKKLSFPNTLQNIDKAFAIQQIMISPLSDIDKILDKHSVTKCNLYLKQFCISVIINKIIESIYMEHVIHVYYCLTNKNIYFPKVHFISICARDFLKGCSYVCVHQDNYNTLFLMLCYSFC